MKELNIETARMTYVSATRSIVVKRVRFVSHPITGTRIRRTFKDPRPCLAVEQTIDLADLPRQSSPMESLDSLYIVYVPPETKAEWERIESGWLRPTSEPESPEAVSIPLLGDMIHWRPGRVVVEGKMGLRDEILAALIEFAFYEGEVRTLEEFIEKCEAQARIDAPKTYQIHGKDRAEWARFGTMMENLAQYRLTFAALEPRIERGSRMLSKPSRLAATRLFRAAATSSRMEGLDARLEVCEEIYEGAIDRIADYKGWHTGHVLEFIIIGLLLLEAALMAAELLYR